ncbi:MAG: type II and III secretion system protein family protein [Burkholderiales bacterium]
MLKHKSLALFLALICFFAVPGLSAQEKGAADGATLLTMYHGEVRTLKISKVQRVAVGNGRLLTTTVLDNELVLLAESAGDTSLFIWLKDGTLKKYRVRIAPGDVAETVVQVRKILSVIPGMKVEQVGAHAVVTGAASKANLALINNAVGKYPQVLNMAREEDVTMRKMVYLKVQLIEFRRSAFENLGVQWQQQITGPTGAFAFDAITSGGFTARQSDPGLAGAVPGRSTPNALPGTAAPLLPGLPPRVSPPVGYLGIATSITSMINLAVTNGDAYILATPELSTRSGGEAKFLAGGQIPIVIPASGLSPASVTYKDYGIKLTIKPVADADSNIVATIQTEVSSIDPATSVAGNPGFLTRQTDSEINVKTGQTIVMSGLVNSDLSNQVDKLPWLGDLPILGALFRSTSFRNNRSDLVVFVTPQVFDPSSTLNRERVEKGKDLRERYEGFIGKKGIVD